MKSKEQIKIIKENNIKLKVRGYYHRYGYAIAELVLNEIIQVIHPDSVSKQNFYIKVRDRIINKELN